MMHLYFQQHFL